MSAYKDLEALLGGTPLARRAIDAALGEHAHKLAEKIRAGIDYNSGNTTPDYIAGATDGADLIDPEKPDA